MTGKNWLATLASACVITIALISATPEQAIAQDCGTNCNDCGAGRKEGSSYSASGNYWMACVPATNGCSTVGCGIITEMVRDAAPAPTVLLNTLRSVSLDSLARLAPTLKGRLLLHPERSIVAVRGVACQAKAVAALAFLSHERIQILARSGLTGLETFLDQAAKQAQ
jgi:hypothetical protein